jgi:hypothetical protein
VKFPIALLAGAVLWVCSVPAFGAEMLRPSASLRGQFGQAEHPKPSGEYLSQEESEHSKPSGEYLSQEEEHVGESSEGLTAQKGWNYRMTSAISGQIYSGVMTFTISGNSAGGRITIRDPNSGTTQTFNVIGTYNSGTLLLDRDTGLQTIQHYSLFGEGNKMKGVFWNTGKYGDNGTFEIERQ